MKNCKWSCCPYSIVAGYEYCKHHLKVKQNQIMIDNRITEVQKNIFGVSFSEKKELKPEFRETYLIEKGGYILYLNSGEFVGEFKAKKDIYSSLGLSQRKDPSVEIAKTHYIVEKKYPASYLLIDVYNGNDLVFSNDLEDVAGYFCITKSAVLSNLKAKRKTQKKYTLKRKDLRECLLKEMRLIEKDINFFLKLSKSTYSQKKYKIKLKKPQTKTEKEEQKKLLQEELLAFSIKNRDYVYKKREEMRAFVSCVCEEYKAKLDKFMKTQSNRIAKYDFYKNQSKVNLKSKN